MVKFTTDRRELARRRRQSGRDRERHRNSLPWWNTAAPRRSLPHHTAFNFDLARSEEPPDYSERIVAESGAAGEFKQSTDAMCGSEIAASSLETDHTGAIAGLFNTGKYSDVTIFIGQRKHQLPAHGLILGVSSPYFDDALQSRFKEAESREFHLEEYSAHALWRVFQYMYSNTYSEESAQELSDDGDDIQLLKHPRVFALADMFRMENLKNLAVKNFKSQLQLHWISDTFPDCIREVYNNTTSRNDEIRSVVIGVARTNLTKLWESLAFHEVVREGGDFAVELVQSLADVGREPVGD